MSTDKNTKHSYFSHYEKMFNKFNKNNKLNILEIGVETGGGLIYLNKHFPNADILGIDINFEHFDKKILKNKNIKIIEENGYDNNFIKKNFSNNNVFFDIIIDDSPHTLESQIFAIDNYSKLLKRNGILVIEDVVIYKRKNKKGECIKELKLEKNLHDYINNDIKNNFKIEFLDLTHERNRFDNALLILEKI